MRLTIISIAIILGCLSLPAQEPTRSAVAGGGLSERFRQLDRNGDGSVTREESDNAAIGV